MTTVTHLRKRMVDTTTIRGLAENTKCLCLNSDSGLACYDRLSPEKIFVQEVQNYLFHLHEKRGLSWAELPPCAARDLNPVPRHVRSARTALLRGKLRATLQERFHQVIQAVKSKHYQPKRDH